MRRSLFATRGGLLKGERERSNQKEDFEQKVAKDAKKRRKGRPEGSDLCFLRGLLFKSGLPING